MKKIKWGILFLLLAAAIAIAIIWIFVPKPEEREYNGLFVMGHNIDRELL